MEENPFENNELCSGGQCASKEQCARYMGNVDTKRAKNIYTVINRTARVCCVHFLNRPGENYPDNGQTHTNTADSL